MKPTGNIPSNQKLTKEIVNERLKERPLILIGDYVNALTVATFSCSVEECKYVWPATPASVMSGCGCPKCSKVAKITIEGSKEKAKLLNILILSEFKLCRDKIQVKCLVDGCGHTWPTSVNRISRGHGCPKCANSAKLDLDVIEKKLNKNIIMMGEYKNTADNIQFKCLVCGREFPASLRNMLRGQGCAKCAKVLRLTKDEIELRIKDRPIIFIGDSTICSNVTKWKCKICGETWNTAPNNIFNGKGCPFCKLKNETRIRKYLKAKYGDDEANKLRIEIGTKKLIIDFVVNGVFIEYNGE